MVSHRPILVTGSPRSGTSWVGRMLSQAPFVRYVHEPFNISKRACRCGIKFDYWFHYLSPENSHLFYDHLKHTIFPSFSRIGLLNLVTAIARTRRVRPITGYLQSYLSYRVVVKDPLAVFSAKTLADLFNMDVVLLIRHPAAVVNSYKALNWTHPFSHFMRQVELMEEHLSPFRREIEDFAQKDYDIVDQISLLWKLIHHMIIKFQATNSDWVSVRYEDLALAPIDGFRTVFERTGLPFSKDTKAVIEAHNLRNLQSNTTRPYAIKQNRQHVTSKWKKALTPQELYRLRRRVEPIASAFYSEQDWIS